MSEDIKKLIELVRSDKDKYYIQLITNDLSEVLELAKESLLEEDGSTIKEVYIHPQILKASKDIFNEYNVIQCEEVEHGIIVKTNTGAIRQLVQLYHFKDLSAFQGNS